jgi:hypothetical protein
MKKLLALTLVLSAGAAAAQQPGNVDVTVRMVNDRRSTGHFSQLGLTLELPKVKSSEVAALRVLIARAVDDSGRDLRDAEGGEPELEVNPRVGMDEPGVPAPAAVGLLLKNPDRKATKIAEVRGEIELFMPSKDPNSVAEIPKFITLSGKSLSHKALKANGVDIALLSAAQIEAEKKKRTAAKKKEYEELGYSGEDLDNAVASVVEPLFNGLEDEVLVRIKDPDKRIQQISYVVGDEVKPVMVRDGEGLAYLSSWGGKPQADWKMRVSMTTPKNVVRYAFALNDVPLP